MVEIDISDESVQAQSTRGLGVVLEKSSRMILPAARASEARQRLGRTSRRGGFWHLAWVAKGIWVDPSQSFWPAVSALCAQAYCPSFVIGDTERPAQRSATFHVII